MVIYTICCIQKDYVSGRKFRHPIASFTDKKIAEEFCAAMGADCIESPADSIPLYICGFEIDASSLDPEIRVSDKRIQIGSALAMTRYRQSADFDFLQDIHVPVADPIPPSVDRHAADDIKSDDSIAKNDKRSDTMAENAPFMDGSKSEDIEFVDASPKDAEKKAKATTFDPDVDTLNMDTPIMGGFNAKKPFSEKVQNSSNRSKNHGSKPDVKTLCGIWLEKSMPDYEPGVISRPFKVCDKTLVTFTALRVGSKSDGGGKWYLGSVVGILDCSNQKTASLVWKQTVPDKFENKKIQCPEATSLMKAIAVMHGCQKDDVRCHGVYFSQSEGTFVSYSIVAKETQEVGVAVLNAKSRISKVCMCCTNSKDGASRFHDIPLFVQ